MAMIQNDEMRFICRACKKATEEIKLFSSYLDAYEGSLANEILPRNRGSVPFQVLSTELNCQRLVKHV